MKNDLITLPKILMNLPFTLPRLSQLIRGALRASQISDPTKPLGLGLKIEEIAQDYPNGVAIIYESQVLTYEELNQYANQYAHYFVSKGLAKGDSITVFLENRPEYLCLAVACAKMGVAMSLINTQQRDRVLRHSFQLIDSTFCIIGEELLDAFEAIKPELPFNAQSTFFLADTNSRKDAGVAPQGYTNLAKVVNNQPISNLEMAKQVFLDDPLFYIFTSGTTGLPKAVVFTQGRWQRTYEGMGISTMQLSRDDRIYAALPFFHSTSMCLCWSSALAGQSAIIIARKFSLSRFWDDIIRYQATAFTYIGEICRYLMLNPPSSKDRAHRVKKILGNGMRIDVWKPFKERFGINEVYEIYASSEGNIGFTNAFNFDDTVGFSPLPYAIVDYDEERDEPVRNSHGFMSKVKKGEKGLLLGKITAETPFHGYTDKEKTNSVILSDVFTLGDRYFNSGDILRDIGYRHAQFIDRTGDTFRWKGENVSTNEIEQILDAHPAILEAVVYGVEIPNTNGRCGMASLRFNRPVDEHLKKDLYDYMVKKIPKYAIPLFFRSATDFEITATFKHQKFNLKKEGFDTTSISEDVYVLLPNTDSYQNCTLDLYNKITGGEYNF